jgi:hypothetical protein
VKTYSYSLNAFAAWFIFSCFAGKLNGILQAGPLDPTSNAKMLLAGLASGFSERLFPDLLKRVSKAIEPSQKMSPSE